MKIHVAPTGLYSPAMLRIANALATYTPPGIEIVDKLDEADLVIMYVIGSTAIEEAQAHLDAGRRYAVVQCCYKTAGLGPWINFWHLSELVWSYYDLSHVVEPNYANRPFYHAPLGVDTIFTKGDLYKSRDIAALTTGTTTGGGAEAIDEVWQALDMVGLRGYHVGPDKIEGSTYRSPRWKSASGISDQALIWLMERSHRVAALRRVEGFELPAVEGLMCGARPVLFDHHDLRYWYGSFAEYVTDSHPGQLVDELRGVFSNPPRPVTESEKRAAMFRFDWSTIASEFWKRLLK